MGIPTRAAQVITTDICVYGGTASGVAAAVQTGRMGRSVALAESGNRLGGLTSGGLGMTDIGNKQAIGGIAREFYHRVALHYASDDAWRSQSREDYFNRGSRSTRKEALGAADSTMWTFEPSVAENILKQMLAESGVRVHFQQRLASVMKTGPRITEITMESGEVYRAKMFIDATYEGDLMARAGVKYTVGREPNALYHETLNGVRANTPKHQFDVPVDPYIRPREPGSGLLPFIQPGDGGRPGDGDHRVQAYNFRLCFTTNTANRLPLRPPANYDPAQYELLARYIEARVAAGRTPELRAVCKLDWMPNGKTDMNNNGAFSTDFIGANYDYPNADYATRARIWKAHEDYTRGFWHFLCTNPRLPESLRREASAFGLCRDEFTDTGGWPHQLYVREARRMVSDYVMTEHNCRGEIKAADAIGLGAYGMDSHNCQRIVKNGHVENEGDVQAHGFPPYPISYRSIIPSAAACENLVVPVCLSATHIAYGSIRMEPVFMILGQSAATAAALAIAENWPLQKVPYQKLRARLLADKQVLDYAASSTGQRALPLKGKFSNEPP